VVRTGHDEIGGVENRRVGQMLHLGDHAYGLWAGLAVDDTAEATAAGALYSDAAGKSEARLCSTSVKAVGHSL
jgi:uncharacterized membrane protein YadS